MSRTSRIIINRANPKDDNREPVYRPSSGLKASSITINRAFEVLGDDKILVPGCEPTSAMTSTILAIFQRKSGICKSSIVDLKVVMDAIPGAYLIFKSNYGSPRKRFLILPPFNAENCPCPHEHDWYAVIRRLAGYEPPMEEKFDHCNIIGTGFCPSPDFKSKQVGPYGRAADGGAPVDTYSREGENDILNGNYYTP